MAYGVFRIVGFGFISFAREEDDGVLRARLGSLPWVLDGYISSVGTGLYMDMICGYIYNYMRATILSLSCVI